MTYIRDIDDMSNVISSDMLNDIFDKIIKKILSHIPNMRSSIYGRSARIDTNLLRIEGLKYFYLTTKGVVERNLHYNYIVIKQKSYNLLNRSG